MVDETNTQPPAAQAPATAENAPVASAPKENLALRYKYDQLDLAHKQMADRIALIIMAYPDITQLPDPKQQQDMIDGLLGSKTGKEFATKLGELGGKAKELGQTLLNADPTGVGSAATSVASAGASVMNFFGGMGKGTDIAFAPVTVPAAGVSEFFNQAKVLFNDMTPEKARDIATSYTSTLQARETDRANQGLIKTATNSWGDAWAVITAGFAWVGSMLAQLPVVGDWMAKTFDIVPGRSFAEHMNRKFAEVDIKTAGAEMRDIGKRNGVDYAAWGSALSSDKVNLQNRAGQDVALKAPSADNREPTLPGAAKDAQGNPVNVPANASAVLADASSQAGGVAADALKQKVAGIDSTSGVLGAGAGAALVLQGARGAAEGTARQWAARPGVRAEKLTGQVNTLAEKIAAAGEAPPKTSAWQFWRKTPEQIAAMEEKLATLKAQAVKEGQTAAARTAGASNFAKAAQVETHGVGLIEKTWNAPRVVGRWFGDKFGVVAEKTVQLLGRGGVAAVETVRHTPEALGEVRNAAGTLMQGSAKAAALYVAPAIESVNLVTGIVTKDQRLVTTATAAINTITAGVVAGAAGGALLGGVGAIPGAIAGLIAGSVTAIGSSYYAGKRYDARMAAQQAAAAQTAPAIVQQQVDAKVSQPGLTNEELVAANAVVIDQARRATAAPKVDFKLNLGTNFAKVNATTIGSLSNNAIPGSTGGRGNATSPVVS